MARGRYRKEISMIRALVLIGCLAPAAAFAQPNFAQAAGVGAVDHMMHRQYVARPRQTSQQPPSPVATRGGQDAFATIQEIVEILAADPKTDWSKVNIDALRQHLIDTNNVTLNAQVTNVAIDGGMIFALTGDGPVRGSIRRMVMAHAATINGVDGWRVEAAELEDGANLVVHAPAKDLEKLRGLGFLGVLALGMHHQEHHLMIARGEDPHE
jgi:hypothetical protein